MHADGVLRLLDRPQVGRMVHQHYQRYTQHALHSQVLTIYDCICSTHIISIYVHSIPENQRCFNPSWDYQIHCFSLKEQSRHGTSKRVFPALRIHPSHPAPDAGPEKVLQRTEESCLLKKLRLECFHIISILKSNNRIFGSIFDSMVVDSLMHLQCPLPIRAGMPRKENISFLFQRSLSAQDSVASRPFFLGLLGPEALNGDFTYDIDLVLG